MPSTYRSRRSPCHTYNNGQPYIPARGRYAPREAVEDYYRSISHAVVDLDGERPTRDEFLRKINREWKIRFYTDSSKRNYSRELRIFVDWFGSAPHLAGREDVRDFLEFLADCGRSSSTENTRVARSRPTQLVSPLDRLSAKTSAHTPAQPAPVQNTPPPVGRLEIHMRAAPDCGPDERRAQVTLGIQHPSGPVYLKGIVVREMRPGWLNVQVPPMESWTDPMRRLTHDQRERLETPEFYELLQREISRRFTPELFQSG